jgi:hypothetical protein
MLNMIKICGLLSIASVFAISANALQVEDDFVPEVIEEKLALSLNDVDDVTKRIDFYTCFQDTFFCSAKIIITKRDGRIIEKKLPLHIGHNLNHFRRNFSPDSANIITEENNPVCNVALSNYSPTLTAASDYYSIGVNPIEYKAILSPDKCKNHVIRPQKDKAYSDAKGARDLLIHVAQDS